MLQCYLNNNNLYISVFSTGQRAKTEIIFEILSKILIFSNFLVDHLQISEIQSRMHSLIS